MFVHKGIDGGQLAQRISNGLVKIGWYLPIGDVKNVYPVPLAISNLRGDASAHEKCLKLLCQISSAVIVFYGDCTEKGRQLLLYCRDMESKLILIDVSVAEDSSVLWDLLVGVLNSKQGFLKCLFFRGSI